MKLETHLLCSIALCATSLASAQTPLLSIDGAAVQDRFGNAACPLGDVNGDGHDDVGIAAFAEGTTGLDNGVVRAHSGADGVELYSVAGTNGKDYLGYSLAAVGDVDLDGIVDFLAGAPQSQAGGNPSGYARLFSGADGSVIRTLQGVSAGDEFGWAVTGLGDVDGDGVPDMAVAARDSDEGGDDAGSVTLFSGADGSPLLTIYGDAPDDWLGWSVADAGDVNQDGAGDVAIGIPGADPGGHSAAGRLRVVSGTGGNTLFQVSGTAANDNLGLALAAAGDVNGDGRADLIVGAPSADPNGLDGAGEARVLSGVGGALIWRFEGEAPGDQLGTSVAGIGDIDQDGIPDLAVGIPWADPGGDFSGRARVYSGSDGSVLRTIDGTEVEESLGEVVAPAGDVNGDAIPDFVVGSPFNDTNGTNAGNAAVWSGFDCPDPEVYCLAYANSVGAGAHIGSTGSSSLLVGDFVLRVTAATHSQPGVFYFGTTRVQFPFGDGWRCVGGQIVRLSVQQTSPTGIATLALSDFPPLPAWVEFVPGSEWNFQFWYRDPHFPNGSGFNLSDGLGVTWCP